MCSGQPLDGQPAGNVPPPGPSSNHAVSQRTPAALRPAGFGPHTAPALGAAAPSWPPTNSGSSLPPRLLRLRTPGMPRMRSLSEGALPRRTRSSGIGTPGPDLDSVLQQRRRENRRRGKGGKKGNQKGHPVNSIFFFFFAIIALLNVPLSSFVRPFVRFNCFSLLLLFRGVSCSHFCLSQ